MTIEILNICNVCKKTAQIAPTPAEGREDVGWLKVISNWNQTQGPEQIEEDFCSLRCIAKWCLQESDSGRE